MQYIKATLLSVLVMAAFVKFSIVGIKPANVDCAHSFYYEHKTSLLESISNTEKKLLELQNKKLAANRFVVREDMSVLTLTGYSSEKYDSMLKGTPLFGHGEAFVQIEKEVGINGLFMLALTGQEQDFGRGSLARDRNNLTSFAAWDYNIDNASRFDSYEECLIVTAKMLKEDYLTEGAKYYNGYTAHSINVRYATDKHWANRILSIMGRLNSEIE